MANGLTTKTASTPNRNGNILNFFSKTPKGQSPFISAGPKQSKLSFRKELSSESPLFVVGDGEDRAKRRRLSDSDSIFDSPEKHPRQSIDALNANNGLGQSDPFSKHVTAESRPRKGPFADDDDEEDALHVNPAFEALQAFNNDTSPNSPSKAELPMKNLLRDDSFPLPQEAECFDDVEGLLEEEDLEYSDSEDIFEGEELLQMRWLQKQEQLELEANTGEGASTSGDTPTDSVVCPVCGRPLENIAEIDIAVHVNQCLDGTATSPPPQAKPNAVEISGESANAETSGPAQSERKLTSSFFGPKFIDKTRPIPMSEQTAFTKLMKTNAEDQAWAQAAANEVSARGKAAYLRSCPFYKVLPGLNICVDAFRYGAVPGCKAYFLSHFHSDHYVGLTSTWSHGPIYCSRVTANLVRQQLQVDPKFVVDLEFEQRILVPGTPNVYVRMISANHCPGSSLFLFERVMGSGPKPKLHRILHCGDFRASPEHIRHPDLRPESVDPVTGKPIGQQKLDVCYLDTTYLNPKYAFPEQGDVIEACAELCVNLAKGDAELGVGSGLLTKLKAKRVDNIEGQPDGFTDMVNDDADSGRAFVGPTVSACERTPITSRTTLQKDSSVSERTNDRLLVVIGTYSIGKERICLGIAKALQSKIYASAGKTRICGCLEDPELDALLTRDPREAQIHMTPLMEIRAETLQEYLEAYKPYFTRVVGFRPSGWTYRPPSGRFIESPLVSSVLRSDSWVSRFTAQDFVPQRGSSKEARCYGVPYSEHSSFKELTMFCCALRIDKIIPTVNIGSAKSREKMRLWFERWAQEKKKNGLFTISPDQKSWRG
jgi:DNA cross-link repair 1A protein